MSALDAGTIAAAVPGAVVLTGGGLDGYDVCGVRPQTAAQARGAEDVAAVLRLASEHGWTVAPRGGGTMLDLGNPPSAVDLVLDLTGLNRVVDYQPDDLTLTVEAGVTVAEVGRLLQERGQMLPLDVPLPEQATIGGALATNACGPRRLRYGTARDLCIGMQVALADGSLVRSGGKVVKNVAGYDLNKLHIGALGTVGVIVEATFKLWPAPEGRGGLVATFDSLDAAHAVAMDLLNGKLFPAAVELIGPRAGQRLAEGTRAEPGPDQWLLAVLLLGVPEAVARQTREIMTLCTRSGSPEVTGLNLEGRERLFARLRDFGRGDEDAAALIVRANVLPSEVPRAVVALRRFAEALGVAPALICRPSAGLAFGYWRESPEMTLAEPLGRAREELASLSGTLVVERATVAALAGLDVWGIAGPDVGLMRRLKRTYDPAGILNPGRFVAGL